MKRRTFTPTAHDIETEGLPSASGFDAEFRCLGKRALCAQLPKEEDTAAGRRGRRIHAALQAGDFSELSESEGRTASRIAYGESEIVHEYGFEGAEVTFEERFWDFDTSFKRTWSARIDRFDWMAEQRRLLIIDDKSGWTLPPPIYENWQVRSEGALMADRCGAVETIVALIHPHHADSLWEAKVYSLDEMRHLLDIVRHNVAAIQQPEQPRTPGGMQCQWCVAKRICPEYKAAADALDQAISDEVQDQGFTAILRQTPAERGSFVAQLHERIKTMQFVLEQYVELAVRDGEDKVKGWRLQRRLIRSITNEIDAMQITRDKFGEDALTAALQFNVVALEEYIGTSGSINKKEAKVAVEEALAPVLKFARSKYFLKESRSI